MGANGRTWRFTPDRFTLVSESLAYTQLLSLLHPPTTTTMVLGSDKHFLNDPSTLVEDSLHGLRHTNPTVNFDATHKGSVIAAVLHPDVSNIDLSIVIFRKSHDRTKVSLICGGGSGHEPAHAGFVGRLLRL